MGASALTYASGRSVFVRNAEMKVSFLGAVEPGHLLECVATVLKGGSRTAFVEAELRDLGPAVSASGTSANGRLVAKASSTYLYAVRTPGS
jgi:acyl-coenzyme A thioesterase PaaI-like protein